MSQTSTELAKKFVRWLDPKLERYRVKKPVPTPPPYVPKTLEDFVGVIQRTPTDVLSPADRELIASAMSFKDHQVRDIMQPREKITFVYEHDFLGPLMLDRLYQSGCSHFPVLSTNGRQVVGAIHTDSLNSLKIRATDRAVNYMDAAVYYMRADYTLDQAMAAFLRTNSYFFMIIDQDGHLVGLLSFERLVRYILGYVPADDFEADSSLMAVAKRKS